MPLIDTTYFRGEIYIGQLSSIEVQENVNVFINKYEAKFLKEIFKDETVPDLSANTDILTAFAHYVYFFYVNSEYYQRSGIGATLPKSENSEVVSPNYEAVFAWNQMVDLVDDGIKSIDSVTKNPFCYKNRFDI